MRPYASIPVLFGALAALLPPSLAAQQSWVIGPWVRVSQTPVITPRPTSTFVDQWIGKPFPWEALHTFNPVAVVRNGKIAVLYRAEGQACPGNNQTSFVFSRS